MSNGKKKKRKERGEKKTIFITLFSELAVGMEELQPRRGSPAARRHPGLGSPHCSSRKPPVTAESCHFSAVLTCPWSQPVHPLQCRSLCHRASGRVQGILPDGFPGCSSGHLKPHSSCSPAEEACFQKSLPVGAIIKREKLMVFGS